MTAIVESSSGSVPALGARVGQIAKVLGEEPAQIIRRLAEFSDETFPIHAWLDADLVSTLLDGHRPQKQPADAEQFIIDSFAAARAAPGRKSWSSMTMAVLKNRIIAASEGTFDETEYGAPNMPYFVRLYPNLLEPKQEGVQASVTLRNESAVPDFVEPARIQTEEPSKRLRVRSDLWLAIMDYSSGSKYVWDDTSQLARRATAGDAGAPLFPTVERSKLLEWREELYSSLEGQVDELARAQIRRWIEKRAGTMLLPVAYRAAWNAIQNNRVLDLLNEFFAEKGSPPPRDLLVSRNRPVSRGSSEEETLRSFLHRCVDAMTDEELSSVNITARVALRAGTTRGH